jgi:hypothetical protein
VDLLLNLRRGPPVETAARAQLTATEDAAEDASVDAAVDAEESSRSL